MYPVCACGHLGMAVGHTTTVLCVPQAAVHTSAAVQLHCYRLWHMLVYVVFVCTSAFQVHQCCIKGVAQGATCTALMGSMGVGIIMQCL